MAEKGSSAPKERPRRWDWAKLESPGLTAAFWTTVGAFVSAFWLTPLVPSIDYPQHLALGAILRRLMDSSAAEHQLYEITLLSYNGLFQVAVAALSLVVHPETAGKLLLSLVPILTGLAGLALARVARRPLWTAFFLLPFSFGFVMGWGFVNYCLGTPLALLVFTWWLRWRDGERRMLWRVIVGALVVAYAHALVSVCLWVSVAIAFLCSRNPRDLGVLPWLRDLVRAPLPVLPAVVYIAAVFQYHRAQPHFFWAPDQDGTDVPAWTKLRDFAEYSVGNLSDGTDRMLLWVMLGLLATLVLAPLVARPATGPKARPELVGLAISWLALYVITPQWVVSTAYIFERLPIWFVAFAAVAIPVPGAALAKTASQLVAALAVATGLNTAWHFARIPDARDASAIIDDIPAGARAVAVMHASDAEPVIARRIWVHLIAYHTVRRPGELAFSFTRYASLPVRYRQDQHPPWYAGGIEWYPSLHNQAAPYGAYFTTVLVKTPDSAPDADPRHLTFGDHAPLVRLLSQRGRYYLYDASAVHHRD